MCGTNPGRKSSVRFAGDVHTLVESQTALSELLKKHAEGLKKPAAKVVAKQILEEMQQTIEILTQSEAESSLQRLSEAIPHEQTAYQLMLKLRTKEHSISQGQSGSGSGSGGSRSQQQLQQLKLDKKENRYQTEKTAQKQLQSNEHRENLQALNRLRDLSRRQEGLNKKLQDLQAMLREAKTEQEKAEIRRQLKRLREEQKQQLRDLDELKHRMQQQPNQSQQKETKQQLEQARQRLLQSSEALQKGQLSQALNSGSRAQKQLQNLRDDFRKKTSSQFADAHAATAKSHGRHSKRNRTN